MTTHTIYQLYDKRDNSQTPKYTGRTTNMDVRIKRHLQVSKCRKEPVNIWKRSIGANNIGYNINTDIGKSQTYYN